MPYCRPASQFCCGCSVPAGVGIILFLHFAASAIVIFQATASIFFPNAWMSSDRLGVEVALAGFALAGLPVILAAAWGVLKKTEPFIRLYLAYLVFTLLGLTCAVIKLFVLSGPCEGLPAMAAEVGRAFACGVARAVNGAIVVSALGLAMYLAFVVWSYAEDLSTGGGQGLADLMLDEDALDQKRQREDDPYEKMLGLSNYAPQDYGSIYDVAVDGGLGGSTRIFNGRRHEMEYPPPKRGMKMM